ncbi:hypothetical protein [Xanthobacter oligotrophicus]|uniref:hypothetical protein n=1 Tax=Xanthobacter oligotrophicus TaxID=2607286 RepID=UPI001EE58F17|nr:hypothetical protein [Xanthobacter oligotrophicus]MCG5238121.1 hypothetical protein [Xanthobacter oligotrophicus]
MRILKPRYWYPYLRMSRALVDYPIYAPPHLSRESELTDDEAQENFDYFMKMKNQRLQMFLDWMWRNFHVRLSFKPESIDQFDLWARCYNGTIVAEEPYVISQSYQSYNPAWTGRFIGCNLIMDAGIYLGEYLIDKRPMIQWEIEKTYFSKFDVEEYDESDVEYDGAQDVVRYKSGDYNSTALRFPNGKGGDPLKLQMYNACNAAQYIFLDGALNGLPGRGFYNSARTCVAQALFFHDLAPDSTGLTPDFSTCPIE